MCDILKNDEINAKTCDSKLIKKIKVIPATINQLMEVNRLTNIEKKLSVYDLINYVIAKDNNYILATGDNRLKIFSEKNGVEVLRVLKIIELMKEYKIISSKKAIMACILLMDCSTTRIPEININNLMTELEKEKVYSGNGN